MNDVAPFIVTGLVTGSIYGLAGVGLVLVYRTSAVFYEGGSRSDAARVGGVGTADRPRLGCSLQRRGV